MKKDQLMIVSLMSGELHIYHNSTMGNLSELFKLGNTQRMIGMVQRRVTRLNLIKVFLFHVKH